MRWPGKLLGLAIALSATCDSFAQTKPKTVELTVDGLKRDAIVYAPDSADKTPSPVVFGFHGHGGTAKNVAKSFNYQTHWPQAIVVYMQGVPIASKTDPEGKKSGWQNTAGIVEDRDLKFFDAVFSNLKKTHNVDEARVYATGHSNGGGFTYLLWSARGDLFAALAPSSAGAALAKLKTLKPKPVLHVAGETDAIVPFENQAKTMTALRKLNGCEETGKAWATHATLYPSATGTPVVTVIHPGGHAFLADAPKLIVRFFKEHAKK